MFCLPPGLMSKQSRHPFLAPEMLNERLKGLPAWVLGKGLS